MNKVKLVIKRSSMGIDFKIKNFSEVDTQILKKLHSFALKRNGYFQYNEAQFGIQRKVTVSQLLQIFEMLDIPIESITEESVKEEEQSYENISEERIEFGKHKGKKWSEIPISYLKWLYKETENDYAYNEIKRRRDKFINIEEEIVKEGKFKGEKWIFLDTNYLKWIIENLDKKHELYIYAQLALENQKDRTIDIEEEIVKQGKFKGKKWIFLPTNYLIWIIENFDREHEFYRYAKLTLDWKV